MDTAAKMYVANTVTKMIPLNGEHFNAALVKRFPKAFGMTSNGILTIVGENLTDKDCKVLIRAVENKDNTAPYGAFFSANLFWKDLVRDWSDIGERATVALARILNVSMKDVTDVVAPSADYAEITLLVRNGQHKTIGLKKARNLLRKDHYHALKNGWGSYYGPLFNWL